MVNMVPREAFACSCAEGDVVLRQSFKPESCELISLLFNSLRNLLDVNFFMERDLNSSIDEFSWSSICKTFNTSKLFFRTFNTFKLFFRTFNTSKLFFTIFKKCRVLKLQALAWKDKVLKLQALAWKDKCPQGNNEYAYAPEQHTVNSAALLHEVLNEMEKLDLKQFVICNVQLTMREKMDKMRFEMRNATMAENTGGTVVRQKEKDKWDASLVVSLRLSFLSFVVK
nr:hypothetical protein [Tanacetum cinerariifolium]